MSEQSIWFRVGYALERARRVPSRREGDRSDRTRGPGTDDRPRAAARLHWPSADELVTSGVAALVTEVLDVWRPTRRTRFTGLLRAGASGAAAALLVDLLRPLLSGVPRVPALDQETGDRLLAGVGQGLLYGAVIEPRVPGPPLLKGALFASAEYAADPAGGLAGLLGPHAPQRRLPVVGDLLGHHEPHDRAYLEHLVFGIALAVLYGSSPSSNGILPEAEAE